MIKILFAVLAALLLASCGLHDCNGVSHCYEVKSGLPQFSKTTLIYVKYLYQGGWVRDQTKVILQAEKHLRKQLNAPENKNKKLAIIFNTDETLLESPYLLDYEANYPIIEKHHLQANFKAIKPTIELFNLAKANNVAIFIVTGRYKEEEAATIKNLKLRNIAGWKGIYFRTDETENVSRYKSTIRKKISGMGYKIIINVGSQFSDLCGEDQAEMNFKLPNPFYYIPGCEAFKQDKK